MRVGMRVKILSFFRDLKFRIKLFFVLRKANKVSMSEKQLRDQKRSFVYGNCKLSNDNVTREMVNELDINK
ncbi:hypothetical protein N8Z24_00145 [bacterium]|nr:hypothetical protein [bacterium]